MKLKAGRTKPATASSSLGQNESVPNPDELLYVPGTAVRGVASIAEGMVSHTVPASTFAVITHRGPIADLPETIRCGMEVWLPGSGYRWNLLEVERYDHRFSIESPEESEMEIWIGVVPEGG